MDLASKKAFDAEFQTQARALRTRTRDFKWFTITLPPFLHCLSPAHSLALDHTQRHTSTHAHRAQTADVLQAFELDVHVTIAEPTVPTRRVAAVRSPSLAFKR